jgi:chemotaxis signal transduction protein
VVILKTQNELDHAAGRNDKHLTTSEDPAGLLVDGIGDVLEADESQIQPAPGTLDEFDAELIRGVAPLEGGLLVLLRLDRILALPTKLGSRGAGG